MGKNNMINNINKMLRVVVNDGREITGRLLVYDNHMNIVISECVETRPQTRKMKTEGLSPTRNLGLILLRGEHVVSVTVLKDAAGSKKNADFDKAPISSKAGVKRARAK